MRKNVIKVGKKFIRKMCGQISIETLAEYLQEAGYEVIFCDLKKGNAVLERINMTDYAKKVEGFTCSSDEGKYVFIDNTKTSERQLMTLAHEVGHSVLRHLDDDEDNEHNRYVWEFEADTFAYVILRHQRKKHLCIVKSLFSGMYAFVQGFKMEYKKECGLIQ